MWQNGLMRLIATQLFVGSIPTVRSNFGYLAQQVERFLHTEVVAGSIPAVTTSQCLSSSVVVAVDC